MATELPVNTWQKAGPPVLFQPALLATVYQTTDHSQAESFQSACPRRPTACKGGRKRTAQPRGTVLLFFLKGRGWEVQEGNAAAAWESSEGRWQRESEQEVLGNKKQERLLTKKTLAKKEKVFLAKKNVLILCSWMRYLKKHCRTFVFNSLILNPEGILSPEWPRTQCSGCHLAQCEPHI